VLRQRAIERGFHLRDAVAVMGNDPLKALRQVDMAQEPDQAVEQQVLHCGVETELHLAGQLVVERIDRAVDLDHSVAVAHGREGGGNG
jgi:hypothetical protein